MEVMLPVNAHNRDNPSFTMLSAVNSLLRKKKRENMKDSESMCGVSSLKANTMQYPNRTAPVLGQSQRVYEKEIGLKKS